MRFRGRGLRRTRGLPALWRIVRAVTLNRMERQDLTAKLAQLHDELSRSGQVDPAKLQQLRELTGGIERLLEQEAPADAEDAKGVSSGLKDLLLKFEADHPELSLTLGKIADGLAAIGI